MKRKVVTLLTLTCIAIAIVGGCGKSALESDTGGTAAEQTAPKESEQLSNEQSSSVTETMQLAEKDNAETEVDYSNLTDDVTEDQLVEGTYSNPASVGEWVDVASGYHDTTVVAHGGSAVNNGSYAHVYYKVVEVCDNAASQQLFDDYNNIADIGGLDPMEEDNKDLQWTAVKYEIYVPYSYSDCYTCKPYLGMLVNAYEAMSEDDYDMTKDIILPDSLEREGGIPSAEYELQRGSYYDGYIFYKTQIGVERDYKLAIYPYNLTLLGDRLNHNEGDPGKYFTIHVMGN